MDPGLVLRAALNIARKFADPAARALIYASPAFLSPEFFFAFAFVTPDACKLGLLSAAVIVLRSLCCCKPRAQRVSTKRFRFFVAAFCLLLGAVMAAIFLSLDAFVSSMQAFGRTVEQASQAALDAKASSEMAVRSKGGLQEVLRGTGGGEERLIAMALRDLGKATEALRAFDSSQSTFLRDCELVPALVRPRARRWFLAVCCCFGVAVLVVIFVGVLVVVSRVRQQSRYMRGCVAVRMLGVCVAAPVAILLGAMAGLGATTGITVGSFCQDVDANVLTIARPHTGAFVFNTSRYYISGEGSNPLVDDLRRGVDAIARVRRTTELATVMPRWRTSSPSSASAFARHLDHAARKLDTAMHLLSRDSIRPQYEAIVYAALCRDFLGAVAWLVALSFGIGTVVVPAMMWVAIAFFEARLVCRPRDVSHGAPELEMHVVH
mmetsp:Transcript_4712/g.13635  ORF Transcript_4712/g.13635 Transcript_4712/m.13635 type:complete len:436 (+) Transcript_4712:92-1399(+)